MEGRGAAGGALLRLPDLATAEAELRRCSGAIRAAPLKLGREEAKGGIEEGGKCAGMENGGRGGLVL